MPFTNKEAVEMLVTGCLKKAQHAIAQAFNA